MPIKETIYISDEEWVRISAKNPVRGTTGRGGRTVGENLNKKRRRFNASQVSQVAQDALNGRSSITTFMDGSRAGVEAERFAQNVRSFQQGFGKLRAIHGKDPDGLPTITVGLRN